jgi:hypothetical protein
MSDELGEAQAYSSALRSCEKRRFTHSATVLDDAACLMLAHSEGHWKLAGGGSTALQELVQITCNCGREV